MFPEEVQSPVVLAASKQWEVTQGNWSSEGTRRGSGGEEKGIDLVLSPNCVMAGMCE